jgi:UDP-GlcNAc3NAcA epimerase
MKILTILGARPQFIKAGSVSREISKYTDINEVIVHTGQHYDSNMSDVFFDEMQIPTPNYSLGIGGGSHGAMTGKMIEKIEEVLIKERPDFLLVYGDTNSTLAGALAAAKLNIKIAHIEAGLRSFNNNMPEEINRILTDRVSHLLFCPTQTAVNNLNDEGVMKWETDVHLVGDVMQDGAFFYRGLSVRPEKLDLDSEFILVTCHRAENTDNPVRLLSIVNALNDLSETIDIVFPMHPRTKIKLQNLMVSLSKRISVIDPVGYLQMIWYIDNCKMVVTDSGGLQKEAFFYAKPCITMRDETEWTELVDYNYNILVGAGRDSIVDAYISHSFADDYERNLYGGGEASRLIVEKLIGDER